MDVEQIGSRPSLMAGSSPPTFVIVDPQTADVLAVIRVVDAIDGDTLRGVAQETSGYASRMGGKSLQGFVIRVDVRGELEAEQIQFYRVWPNNSLQRLTPKTFPDMETLIVAKRLVESSKPPAEDSTPEIVGPVDEEMNEEPRPVISFRNLFLPAIVLSAVMCADWGFSFFTGGTLLTLSQTLLIFGVAMLFTLGIALQLLVTGLTRR